MPLKSFFDFSNSRFSFHRSLTDYWKVRVYLISPLLRNNPLQRIASHRMQQEYLNVGCGSNIQSGFINLDYCWQRGVDLCWDITKKIPLPDNSIKGIFCEHCLEHIPFDQCLNVLKNFRRVLKKEGRIRIVVPDAELYLDLYNKKKSGESVLFPFQTIDDNKTSMMHVNQCFRDHGHQFAYDAETLSKLLEKAGFVDIERRSFMVGKDNTLLIDTESRSKESLYLEAGI